MGLESAAFISALTPSWPLPDDTKSQGDDHIRMIKAVLQANFPNASKPFYLPRSQTYTATVNLVRADENKSILVSPVAGDVLVNLPSTLTTFEAGWRARIIKVGGAATDAMVITATGGATINSSAGNITDMRCERLMEEITLEWSGATWLAYRPGIPIGASLNWDTAFVPSGYRVQDGSVLSAATFKELALVLGTTTLRDKRGRVEIGIDASNVNISSAAFGGVASIGATKGGGGTMTLVTANLPPYTPAGTNAASALTGTVPGHFAAYGGSNPGLVGSSISGSADIANPPISGTAAAQVFTGTAQGGTSTAFSIVQPAIVSNKIIRVA